ncbi:steroidogenic acute regulatory protein-like [Belonocnema kinseyi]|uniref:steroidogenic acute regulatory protein-like n=1 Tax=Belonocnema kinseyi TaxID=2817044 RepID=UPI00143D8FB2|nr:steroidogenic acute regulatory protein-like [Belonocnema kinseyi]XP_033220211.1 steroidogenic acute regulatory protein-like [Belonocnema kinseyi]
MAETDRQMRAVAESLHASIQSQRSSSYSINRATDIILNNEDIIAGARYNGRMSNVRRFFCLFVTFDLLFTCLLWLICSMIAGENAGSAFIDQVVHYQIATSLFDIVMAAICRFTILLLFYALLYINHWIIIALSTALSCAFLITKVFLFDWSKSNQPVFQVLLIVASFVLAWGEAWFFDIRVIPQESLARDWIFGPGDERAPLLRPGAQSSRQYGENVGTFYTPVETPDRSDDEDEDSRRDLTDSFHPMAVTLTDQKKEEYKNKAKALLNRSSELLTSEEWVVDKTTPDGDVISYMQFPKTGKKILRITGTVNVSARMLSDNLFENVEATSNWNTQLTECKKINEIDENTDIVYQATPSFGNGIVTARDFVILRHRGNFGPYFVSCGMSIPFAEYPSRKNYIRGDTLLGCFAAVDLPEVEGDGCRFTWILNTDLKLWMPQKIIDNVSVTALAEFMELLRNHARNLRS